MGCDSSAFAVTNPGIVQEAIQPNLLLTAGSVQGHSGQVAQGLGDVVDAVEPRLIIVKRMRTERLV